jgi:hypothetical protein
MFRDMVQKTAKAKVKPKGLAGASRPKHRAADSRLYENPIVPIEQIAEAASELRADHPQVTDEQAHFVHLLVQTGKNPAQISKLTGKSKQWMYYNMSKAAVCDYRQALAMRVLGWDSAAALATMRNLLTAKSDYIKLEAAKDLLERAGMRAEPARQAAQPISLTFNLSSLAPSTQQEPVTIEGQAEMGPVEGLPEQGMGFKNAEPVQGRGQHTHPQGLGGTSAADDEFTV